MCECLSFIVRSYTVCDHIGALERANKVIYVVTYMVHLVLREGYVVRIKHKTISLK